MNDEQELQRQLEQVAVPQLRDGPHREQLKAELLSSGSQTSLQQTPVWRYNGGFDMTRLARMAATVAIAVLLMASGWAAEKVYQSVVKRSYEVEVERVDVPAVEVPNEKGGTDPMLGTANIVTVIPDDAPAGTADKVRQHHEQMKQLIAEKKYTLVRTFEYPPGSETQYVYRFDLPDGDHMNMNFTLRLEEVGSWDDYLQKSKEQARNRNEQISAAIAAGRCRLLNIEPLVTHVCRDVKTGQRLMVLRIELPAGKEIASVRTEDIDKPGYQTSWQDHLDAVQQGNRELIELKAGNMYTYEITFDDGSTTVFQYGGDEPLKKPEN